MIDWRSAVTHWKLSGPAGAELDLLIAAMVASGLSVQCLVPGAEYRVDGAAQSLELLAEQVNGLDGFDLAHEVPAEGVVSITSVVSTRPARRAVHVAGQGEAHAFVARAVDAGLSVRCDGIRRWAVSGRTSTLMQWLAVHVHQTTLEATLEAWGLTAATAAAEDADAAAPVVQVLLPDRRTTTTSVERDNDGLIRKIVQLEQDVKT
jgi:hypothetical protein